MDLLLSLSSSSSLWTWKEMDPLSSLSKIWKTRSTKKGWGGGYQSTHYSQWTWGNDGVFLMFVKVRNYIFWLDDAFESAECDLPMVSYWLLENLRGKSRARIISTIVKTPSHCLTHHHPQLQLHHHVKVIWARESNVLMMIIRRVIYLL